MDYLNPTNLKNLPTNVTVRPNSAKSCLGLIQRFDYFLDKNNDGQELKIDGKSRVRDRSVR